MQRTEQSRLVIKVDFKNLYWFEMFGQSKMDLYLDQNSFAGYKTVIKVSQEHRWQHLRIYIMHTKVFIDIVAS